MPDVTAPLTIRPARREDTAALSTLSRQTFYETFVDGFGIPYPPADLEAYFVDSFNPSALITRIEDEACLFLVAERDGELLALCHAGPNGLPHAEARDGEMELRRLYVLKSAQGLGLGSQLMQRALDWMQARTSGALWIGVWSGNEKAQRLYLAHGFEKVGEYDYPVGDWLDREFILRRP
jgi:GNAT superfamily N-acetyltransferase